jgi:hypothetical protein
VYRLNTGGKPDLSACSILINLLQLLNFYFDLILRREIYGTVIGISVSINISINTQTFFTDNYSGDKIKKNNVDSACSTYGGEDSWPVGF